MPRDCSTAVGRLPPRVGWLLEAEPSEDVTHLVELLSAELGSDAGRTSRTL